jgi:hypothetical protein
VCSIDGYAQQAEVVQPGVGRASRSWAADRVAVHHVGASHPWKCCHLGVGYAQQTASDNAHLYTSNIFIADG